MAVYSARRPAVTDDYDTLKSIYNQLSTGSILGAHEHTTKMTRKHAGVPMKLDDALWYHGLITRIESESMLQRDGDFLVTHYRCNYYIIWYFLYRCVIASRILASMCSPQCGTDDRLIFKLTKFPHHRQNASSRPVCTCSRRKNFIRLWI
jgi:hypothetical protein